MSTTTVTDAVTEILDDRPLHIRIKESLKEKEAGKKALAFTGGVAGATAGSASAYLTHVVAISFLTTIGVPAWLLTSATYAGYIAVAWGGITGFFIAFNGIRNFFAISDV